MGLRRRAGVGVSVVRHGFRNRTDCSDDLSPESFYISEDPNPVQFGLDGHV